MKVKRTLYGLVFVAALLAPSCSSSSSSKNNATDAGGSISVPAAVVGSGVQFGGDVCTALTKDDIEKATYAEGKAVFAGTESVGDSTTKKTVECHYLVSFNSGPSVIAANVSLLDPSAFANRAAVSIASKPVPLSGLGTEAYSVEPGPGSTEVWVKATNGYFKVFAQPKETAVALATLAAARD